MKLNQTIQFKRGKLMEAYLDQFFKEMGFSIELTSKHQERVQMLGDRVFTRDGQVYYVEYKSGLQTAATGNIWLETVSVDKEPIKIGWAYSCNADKVIYGCTINGLILSMSMRHIRRKLGSLINMAQDYRKTFVEYRKTSHGQNAGYNTHGLIVSLPFAIQELADKTYEVEPWEPEI